MEGPLHDKEPSLVYLKTDHARCFVLFSWCLQHNDVVEVAVELGGCQVVASTVLSFYEI